MLDPNEKGIEIVGHKSSGRIGNRAAILSSDYGGGGGVLNLDHSRTHSGRGIGPLERLNAAVAKALVIGEHISLPAENIKWNHRSADGEAKAFSLIGNYRGVRHDAVVVARV